jgi:hypothetical protein
MAEPRAPLAERGTEGDVTPEASSSGPVSPAYEVQFINFQ